MKRMILTWGVALISMLSLYAQGDKPSTRATNDDQCIDSFLYGLTRSKSRYIGQPASVLYNKFATGCFHIQHMSTESVGPWGKEFMCGVTLYNKDVTEIWAGEDVFIVTIELNMGGLVDDGEFWRSLPDDDTWMEAIRERTKDKKITDFYYEKTRIYSKKE